MAYARISRQWPDQSVTIVEVGVDASYPDAVAEATAAVVKLDREASPSED